MATLTKIGEKNYNDYEREILELQKEIAEAKEELKRTWLNFITHISNYVLNNKKYKENQEKITDLNFQLFLKEKRLAEAEICRDIFNFNKTSYTKILNPLSEWQNSNMPHYINEQITNYNKKYETYPYFLDSSIIQEVTMIDFPSRGGNKKTNSKKYRKSRRKSYKKSHRKYNK
jgi:hypothetical protein